MGNKGLKKYISILFVSISMIALGGCGGSGSGGNDNQETQAEQNQNTPSTVQVSTSVTGEGSITPQSVEANDGESLNFVVTPASGFVLGSVDGCSGSLVGNTYTIIASTSDCEIVVNFSESTSMIAPVANAGVDQMVEEGLEVTLTGSATDADGEVISYTWVQVSGAEVTLTTQNSRTATFSSPEVENDETLVFSFTATDNDGLTDTDTLNVVVEAIQDEVADSGVSVVAALGDAAPGFEDGYVYADFRFPTIGANGKQSFLGTATNGVSINDVLWAVESGDVQLILREDDNLPGLPTNVLLDQIIDPAIVTPRGNIVTQVILKGATSLDLSDSVVLVAQVNDVIYTVARSGDQAPGLPDQYRLGAGVFTYDVSDAGVVYYSTITDGTSVIALGIWYWDFVDTRLIALSEFGSFDNFSITQESFSTAGSSCEFRDISLAQNSISINEEGQIAFLASISQDGNVNCPESETLIKWNDGNYQPLLSTGDATGITGFEFDLDTTLGLLTKINLESDGDIGLFTSITNPNVSPSKIGSHWVVKDDGSIEFLSIGSEVFNNSGGIKSATIPLVGVEPPYSDANGNYLVSTNRDQSLDAWILRGVSRPLPYSDISEVGESQLDTVVSVGDVPPGFNNTAFFSSIGLSIFYDLGPPRISGAGDIYFNAMVSDAADTTVSESGIWKSNDLNELTPILTEGQIVDINGSQEEIGGVIPFNAVGNGLAATRTLTEEISDSGILIATVLLEPSKVAIVTVSP